MGAAMEGALVLCFLYLGGGAYGVLSRYSSISGKYKYIYRKEVEGQPSKNKSCPSLMISRFPVPVRM